MKQKKWPLRLGSAWLDFWFPVVHLETLAVMRVGTGLMLVYVFMLRSYDLEAHFSWNILGNQEVLRPLDYMAWPFSIFNWFQSTGWIWTVHVLAVTTAIAFLLGIFPFITGLMALLFHLSYGHGNPAVLLGLDGLLTLALFYLILVPSGRRLTVLWWRYPPPPPPLISQKEQEGSSPPWGGLPLRTLQIHLCLLYFQSGLLKLNGDWLEGMALLHPRLVEMGGGLAAETLTAHPSLINVIPNALALFELFYCIFIWLPRFRYPALVTALVVHLTVGILWEKLPFNLLMLVLNMAFIPSIHMERLWNFLSGSLTGSQPVTKS